MSDRAILEEIGRRLKRRRLELNLTQQHIADQAGLNRTTVSEIERGSPSGLLTLVQLLRALGSLDDLDAMLPDPGPSPLQLARLKGRVRRRASRQGPEDQGGGPSW
ncbi:MAG: helix-turn-helix transcriptional regulator [Planctomycetota bacterium]